MNNRIYVSVLALGLFVALAATSAHAQISDHIKADVPFDFTVKGKTLPAGEYVVRRMNDSGSTLIIRSIDGSDVMVFLATAATADGNDNAGKLVFNKYGSQYFLTKVQGAGGTARTLPTSRRERDLRKELAAARNLRHETVAIAARF